jgi:hypothetical protein
MSTLVARMDAAKPVAGMPDRATSGRPLYPCNPRYPQSLVHLSQPSSPTSPPYLPIPFSANDLEHTATFPKNFPNFPVSDIDR